MKITQNCVVPNMPDNVYHADPCPEPSLSSSTLIDIIESTEIEAKLNNRRLNPEWSSDDDSDSAAAQLGTIAHDLVLLGGKTKYEIAPFRDFKTADARTVRDDIMARGLIALSQNQAEKVIPQAEGMKAALLDQISCHREYPDLLKNGRGELSAFAHDGTIWNRARLDWLDEYYPDTIVDYKTTGLSFDQWEKQELWGSGAKYVQNWHYKRVQSLLTGRPSRFIFLVQRTSKPFLARIFEIDRSCDEFIAARYKRGYDKFVNCLKTGIWVGEVPMTFHSYPPPWITQKWEADEMNAHILEAQETEKIINNVTMAG